jgi:predicted ribosomally synthesized peptide with SipW-like signal peptide
MSDDKFDLTRRKALLGLGGIGAGAALGGAGTMAVLNDSHSSTNTVTAGKLDLKIDWFKKYYQGEKLGWTEGEQGLTNNPGPIFKIEDAKPGDCGFGYISLHNYYNPAYVWAGCDLKEWEGGRTHPEQRVDDTPEVGELAENIKVALLRFPYVEDTDALASDQTDVHSQVKGELTGDRNFGSLEGCTPIFVTTLKDLCEKYLHGGYLLDGKPKKEGQCFKQSHTYFYSFAWWIPIEVGNEIQSDRLKFDLKFGAVQCRHVKHPSEHNPFAAREE